MTRLESLRLHFAREAEHHAAHAEACEQAKNWRGAQWAYERYEQACKKVKNLGDFGRTTGQFAALHPHPQGTHHASATPADPQGGVLLAGGSAEAA